MDGCGVHNHPQLVFLDIDSVLVKGAFGSFHDASQRSIMDGQRRRM